MRRGVAVALESGSAFARVEIGVRILAPPAQKTVWTQLMDRVSPLTMMRLAPLLTLLTPLVAGFGPSQIASPQTALLASRTEPTWSKYKHDFVDPITPHEQPSGLHEPDSKKRAIADEFWLKQFEDDKDKMHEMMSKDHESRPPLFATDETWDHYKHEFIDPQV